MILAITPARGGSKGLPGKNIKQIAGKPLLAWTIKQALSSTLIDKYIVSTEDSGIAAVAKEYGAEVLKRPVNLAGDHVSTLAVLQHAVKVYPCDTVVVLQATSPIRNSGLIDSCIRTFQEQKADSLATGFVCTCEEYGTCTKPRQEIDGFFYDDGNVYVIKAEHILKGDRYGTKREHLLLDKEQNIDIDDEFDFFVAEQVLLKRMRENKV